MKNKRLNLVIFVVFLVCFPLTGIFGQEAENPEAEFLKARKFAFEGNSREARQLLTEILEEYPRYSDAQTLLANTYRWEGDFSRARRHLNRVTSRDRVNEDAWVSAIYNERQAGNRSIALGLANKALNFLGENAAVSKLRAEILGTFEADETGGGKSPLSLTTIGFQFRTAWKLLTNITIPCCIPAWNINEGRNTARLSPG